MWYTSIKMYLSICLFLISLLLAIHYLFRLVPTLSDKVKSEAGIVVEKQFSPEFNATTLGATYNQNSGGTNLHLSNTNKPEEFLLVFKCSHHTVFAINSKEMYALLNKGDSVTIQYQEYLNYNNEVVDYKFLNAIKKMKK